MPRTPERKLKIKDLERQIKHYRKKADESGETHGRRTKNQKNKR